jgi:hypothetical protein
MLSVVRSGGFLSRMNADIIGREVHQLLEEVASYDEPRLALEDAPSLAELFKGAEQAERAFSPMRRKEPAPRQRPISRPAADKGHIKDTSTIRPEGRREAVLSVLKEKGPSYIKDISTVVRDVSEKTIQRELQALVAEGSVGKEGERRWTRYFLAASGTSV